MSAIYRDEQHAVIRAVAVDAITTCKPSGWQQQYSSGYVEDLTKKHSNVESLSAEDRLTQDCMTRARIHRNVSRGAFYAVVAKYGADEQERAQAVNELVKIVEVEASDDFKRLMIWTWASIAIKRGAIEALIGVCEQSARTFFRKRKQVLEQLRKLEESALSESSVILNDVIVNR